MKKTLFLVLFALISISSYTQITWSVEAGMAMNNVTAVDDSKMKMGYTVGVGMDYAFSDTWYLQSGLKLVNKGFKFKQEVDVDNSYWKDEKTYNPFYLELPILAAAKFRISDNLKFVVNAGPYVAFGLAGKAKVVSVQTGSKFKTTETKANLFNNAKPLERENEEDWQDADKKNAAIMNRVDLGLHFGVGLEINRFLVGLGGEMGFLSAAKHHDETNTKDGMTYTGTFGEKYNLRMNDTEKINPKNMSFMVTVGYRF